PRHRLGVPKRLTGALRKIDGTHHRTKATPSRRFARGSHFGPAFVRRRVGFGLRRRRGGAMADKRASILRSRPRSRSHIALVITRTIRLGLFVRTISFDLDRKPAAVRGVGPWIAVPRIDISVLPDFRQRGRHASDQTNPLSSRPLGYLASRRQPRRAARWNID